MKKEAKRKIIVYKKIIIIKAKTVTFQYFVIISATLTMFRKVPIIFLLNVFLQRKKKTIFKGEQ